MLVYWNEKRKAVTGGTLRFFHHNGWGVSYFSLFFSAVVKMSCRTSIFPDLKLREFYMRPNLYKARIVIYKFLCSRHWHPKSMRYLLNIIYFYITIVNIRKILFFILKIQNLAEYASTFTMKKLKGPLKTSYVPLLEQHCHASSEKIDVNRRTPCLCSSYFRNIQKRTQNLYWGRKNWTNNRPFRALEAHRYFQEMFNNGQNPKNAKMKTHHFAVLLWLLEYFL